MYGLSCNPPSPTKMAPNNTTVYLIRHAQVHNPGKIVYGRLPGFQLSQVGRDQAEHLGSFLKMYHIDAIYSSPMERAQETASYIAKHFLHLPVVIDDRLTEVYTPVEGSLQSSLPKGDVYTKKFFDAGGERLEDIWSRMQSFLKDVCAQHAGKKIVSVSHGDPLMIVLAKYEHKELGLAAIRGPHCIRHAEGFVLTFTGVGVFVKIEPITAV